MWSTHAQVLINHCCGASWDRGVWLKTIVSLSITLVALVALFYVFRHTRTSSPKSSWLAAALGVVLAGFLCASVLEAPIGYRIERGELVVIQRIGEKTIHLGDTVEVSRVNRGAFRGKSRVMASGGLFGYFGKFYHRRIGKFDIYATRKDRRILIRSSDKTVVVTPDNPDLFMKAIQAAFPTVRIKEWQPEIKPEARL